ncbi:MAG: LapA family protein [Alteraurantiacibacter sp.]
MQVIRTIVWVLLVVALALFSMANWTPVSLRVWDGLVIDTMLPALVILAFALGFVPMWLLHRAAQWQAKRRIAALELAAKPVPLPAPPPPPPAPPPPPEPAPIAPAELGPDV